MLLAFKKITTVSEFVYALDWQHDGYWMSPYLEPHKDEEGNWTISVYPDGDYILYVTSDFKNGYLGDPWEKSITIFGDQLISAFVSVQPSLFQKVLRRG